MELISPDKIELYQNSLEILEEIELEVQKIRILRPFPEKFLKELDEELLYERVYNSNAIEGNTLTIRETTHLLKVGMITSGSKKEQQEVLNLAESIKYLQQLIDQKVIINEISLRSIHQIFLKDINNSIAGKYRDKNVIIAGSDFKPPPFHDVPSLMNEFLDYLAICINDSKNKDIKKPVNPIVLSAWAHVTLAQIHPFEDGNGRMARCLQDYVLWINDYLGIIIRQEDRGKYYDALSNCDKRDYNMLIQLLSKRMQDVIDRYLIVAKKDENIEKWAKSLSDDTAERVQSESDFKYNKWHRQVKKFLTDFQLCIEKINETNNVISIQIQNDPIIEQNTWQNLIDYGKERQTRFFIIRFRNQIMKKEIQYVFWFGQHYWEDQDTDIIKSEKRVSILLSKENVGYLERGEQRWKKVEDNNEEKVSFREAFFVDTELYFKSYNPVKTSCEYKILKPLQVAQCFIEEVIRNSLM